MVDLEINSKGFQQERTCNPDRKEDRHPAGFDALLDKVLMAGNDGRLDVADAANLLDGLFATTQTKKK